MRCLHCGRETEEFLCSECRTQAVLAEVFYTLLSFRPEECDNPYISAYAAALPEGRAPKDSIPRLLALFPVGMTEYYSCRYAKTIRDPGFEEMALAYLDAHDLAEENTRRVLQMLLDFYLRNDFIKPRKWCDLVRERNLAGAELAAAAIQHYSMMGEYDLADQMLAKAMSAGTFSFLYGGQGQERIEKHMEKLSKLKRDNDRYRDGKPYWPKTEERRRAVARLYDEKGIPHPRIESKPLKVPESSFKPLSEYAGPALNSYCAFWCAAGFSVVSAKCIYQIAAVKVKEGGVTDRFQSYVRVWDGVSARKTAAKEGGIPLETIESADDVDLVMKRFFEFVGDGVLVSTDALGEQAKLIIRAARYTGIAEIGNPFLDLLDLAEGVLPDLALAGNSREGLLERFGIPEGTNALSKAEANHELYQKLTAPGV